MINYSQTDLKEIAAISEEQHVGLLTNCGVHGDNARKIITIPTDALISGLAAFEGRPNKTDSQKAMIAAWHRELLIRQ